MSLEQYAQNNLFLNVNFRSSTTQPGVVAYRGELVLVEGEIADTQGRRRPPLVVMRHAVLLEKDGKLLMSAGYIDSLDHLPLFIEKYRDDFAPDMKAMFFVVNLTKPVLVKLDGIDFVLIPLLEGITWNEMCDEFALEKVDFKGQSAADKVYTTYQAFLDYAPKYDTVASFDDAMTLTADIKRVARGPV